MDKQVKVATLFLAIASIFSGTVFAQSTTKNLLPKKESVREATSKLRAMFFMQDNEGGSVEGQKLSAEYPNEPELRAWTILNMAAGGAEKEAVAVAEKWIGRNPKTPWNWFALAGALNYHSERGGEALAASEKALAKSPNHADFIWLRAEVLRRQDKASEAVAFVDRHKSTLKNPAELLVSKAAALRSLAEEKRRDQTEGEASFTAFEEARKIDPGNVNAHYLPGLYLAATRRVAEGYPLLKKAIALAPNSTRVHGAYWMAVAGLTDASPEKKQAEIEADIKSLLVRRGDYPGTLLRVSDKYGDLKLKDKRHEIEERILREHGASKEVEWVLVNRYRRFAEELGEEGLKDPKQKETYRRMLRDFINRPEHRIETLLGDTYLTLFFTIEKDDASIGNAELLEIVRGMIKYNRMNVHLTYPLGAIALAERKAYLQEAQAFVRTGMVEGKKKIDRQRKFYETEGDYVQGLNRMNGTMKDALGWIFFHEGRSEEAEKELLKAYELFPENINTLHHLGRFYESKNDLDKAEEFYIKGMLAESPGENPSAKAIRDLYQLRRHNLDGYDDYLGRLRETDAAKRKDKVLAARIAQPTPAAPFNLKTLGGAPVSLESLKRKILVINFWGTWCGPCVKEIPDIQKLHEKYARDPEVVILTIDNDENPDDVLQYMRKNNYSFGVLLDDGYVNQAGVRAFPTTWFVDKQGRTAFIKTGWSEKLVEEFSWRVEELRKAEAQQSSAKTN
jgi:thiol-disulfide isomerase/thioredoxin/Flp pilus assembly protein TadD